jgi:hypothetical protein
MSRVPRRSRNSAVSFSGVRQGPGRIRAVGQPAYGFGVLLPWSRYLCRPNHGEGRPGNIWAASSPPRQ